MSQTYRFVALSLVLLFAALASCVDELEPDVGPVIAGACKGEDSNPDVDVSFNVDILPHLQMGCGCHNPAGSGVSIDSTAFTVVSYETVRRGGVNSHEKIVIANDPCGSYLFQKLGNAPPSGSRMPIFGPYWSRSEMLQLHDWIAEGAHDN